MESLTFQNLFKFSFEFNQLSTCLEMMRTSIIRTEDRLSYLEKSRAQLKPSTEGTSEVYFDTSHIDYRIDRLEENFFKLQRSIDDNFLKFQQSVDDRFDKVSYNLNTIPQLFKDPSDKDEMEYSVLKKEDLVQDYLPVKRKDSVKSSISDKPQVIETEKSEKIITQIITTQQYTEPSVTQSDFDELKSLLAQHSVTD